MSSTKVASIMIGQCRVFYAPVGEALPAITTVLYGGAWGGNWTEFGWTIDDSAVNLAITTEDYDINVREVLGAVDRIRTKIEVVAELQLAELTADNLALLLEESVTTTPAASGTAGYEEFIVSGETHRLTKYAWGIEGLFADSGNFPVRLFMQRSTAHINGNLEHSAKKEMATAMQMKGLVMPDSSVKEILRFQRVTAAALP